MADEVVCALYDSFDENMQTPTIPSDVLVRDIAVSFQIPLGTEFIKLQSREAAFWYTFGGSGVSATAETDGNDFLASGDWITIRVAGGEYIDTAADA